MLYILRIPYIFYSICFLATTSMGNLYHIGLFSTKFILQVDFFEKTIYNTNVQFNIITQSVDYTAKDKTCQGVVGEKGMGCESPARNCRCVYRSFYVRRRKPVIGKLRRQNIKMSGLIKPYMIRVTRPALMLSCKCDVCIGIIFLFACKKFLRYSNCDSSQEYSAVVIFKITAAFLFALVKSGGAEILYYIFKSLKTEDKNERIGKE